MADWKILITDGLEENGQKILRLAAHVDDRSGISPADLRQIIPEYDALIVHGRTRVSADLLENTTRLKVVGRVGVGVDTIDLEAAKARSVIVVNAPTATSAAVAELAIGLIMSLAREIPRADMSLKSGQWLKKELIGIEIDGKKLGVIGMGHIGASVAKKAAALGMCVLGYDPFLDKGEIGRRGAEPVPLTELYSTADFITLHIPLTKETRHFIDAQAFEQMKTGVRLVCTARGGIVDEASLLKSLESGKVAGAALDVFDPEPPGVTPLITHQNLIATPHIGAQTLEAQERVSRDIAEEVLAALEGKPLRWKIV
jgi:D-3-phosphoglycerate dehydrogenase / 2-oxoglutarate reductase